MDDFVLQGQQRISFRDFMQRALYHPRFGYYRSGLVRQGSSRDYITAPSISPLFARCVAHSLVPILKNNPTWSIAEIGPGSGALAAELLAALHQQDQCPESYCLIEPDIKLRAQQKALIANQEPRLVDDCQWHDYLPNTFCGVVIANEVLDALPVHLLASDQTGQLSSIQVERGDDGYHWVSSGLSPDVYQAFCERKIPRYHHYRYEISLDVAPFLQSLYQRMNEGICLFFDYGYSRSQYYHPQRHFGTLQAFRNHTLIDDVLMQPGDQDISCHVDFTLVAESAVAAGFDVIGLTQQMYFLYANGIADALQYFQKKLDQLDFLRYRQSAHILTSPQEMGELIKLIAFSKGVPIQGDILGLPR